jgi:geranylgeranyl pyrophosphate synthase
VLLVAPAQAGALIAGADGTRLAAIGEFARRLGLAFQIRDDILDAEGTASEGKDLGKDAGMPTLVTSLGIAGAREAMQGYLDAARDALSEARCGDHAWRYAAALFGPRKVAA